MSQEFNIVGNLLLKVDGAEAGINKLKSSLSKLEIPKGLENSLNKSFSNLDSIFDRYRKQLSKGFDTKGDVSNMAKIGKELDAELTKFSNHLTKLTGEKIDFKVDTEPVKKAALDLQEVLEKRKQLTQEKAEIKIETQKEGITNLKQLLEEFQRVTGDTRAGRAVGQALAHIETGDLEKALSFLKEAENNLTRIGQKKKEAFGATGFTLEGALEAVIQELSKTDNEFTTVNDKAKLFQDILAQAQAGQLKDVDSLLARISQGFEKNASSARGAAKAAQDYAQSTFSMQQQVNQLQQSTQYFFSLRNMLNLFKRGIREAVDTVKELDKAMTETAVVTKYSVGDMWAKLPEYTANANALGATVQDMYESTTLYYQQGLNTQQAMGIATETMKMARIAGLEAAEATDMMTAALRGFNMEINEASAEHINDVYSNLAAKTASNTEELGTAMQRTASIAHSAGMSFEGTAAFLAQAIETTREPAENLGTAMKTIVARFQELKKNPLEIAEVDGEEVSYNKVDAALKTIGVDLKDTNGQFRDLDKVFLDISQRWDGLSQTQQRYIATTAAGSRQQSRFIAMMSDYERTMELMGYANNSAGASTTQFNKTLDSLEAKINKFQNAWKQFLMGIMNDSWTKKVVDAGTSVLNIVNKIIDTLSIGGRLKGIKSILSTLTAFTALKIAGRGANALIGGLGGMVDPRSSMMAGMRQGALGGRQAANAAQAQMIYQPIVNELRAIRQLQGQQLTKDNQDRIGAYDQFNKFKESRAFLTGLTKGGKTYSLQDIQQSLSGLDARSQNVLMSGNAGTAYTVTKGILGGYANKEGYNQNIAAGIKNSERFWNTQRKTGEKTWEEYFGAISDPRLLKQGIDRTIGNGKYNPAYEFLDNLDKQITRQAAEATRNSEVGQAIRQRYDELIAQKTSKEDLDKIRQEENWSGRLKEENQKQRQKIIQQESGSFKNSNAARVLNTIGQVGSSISQAGMGLQAFGNILTSSANPALQIFGSVLTSVGGLLSGIGMAVSGITTGITTLAKTTLVENLASKLVTVSKIGEATATAAVTAGLLVLVAAIAGVALWIKKSRDNIKKDAEEVTQRYKDKSSENQSNIANLKQWKSELAVLSKGVDENGYNISLDTSDYDHYLEIVDTIAKINPEIVQGYNAQGHAIIDNNKALEETLALEEKRSKELLYDYTKPDSLTKLLKARNLQRNRVGGGGPGQIHIEPVEYELKPRTNMRQEMMKIGQELKRNKNLIDLSSIDIDIDALASGKASEFQKVLDNYNVFERLVSESIDRAGDEWSDKSKEAIEKSFSSFEEYGSELDELVQPVYEALSASASQTAGFKEMSANLKAPFQNALKELATNGEFESGREINEAARNIATKFAGYSETYLDAMEKVDAANKQFALDFNEQEYTAHTEEAINELEALKATLEDTPEGHAIEQWVNSEIRKIEGHLSTGTKSIEEAWDTISDKIAVAESTLESFNKATEKDFYSAADDMQKIYETAMDEDAYHSIGKGDKTFWAAAESLLGSDNIMNKSMNDVRGMMKDIEPFLKEGPEGVQNFASKVADLSKELDGIAGVEMSEDGWFKSINENVNPDAWKEIADYLDISEELLTSMINKSRQFRPIDFSDMESVRESYAIDETVIHGTQKVGVTTTDQNGKESTVQADKLYITDAEFRERMGSEYYQKEARESKQKELEAQGIEVLPEHLKDLSASMMKTQMGIADWQSAIQTFGDTGVFDKSEIYEAAKTLAQEEQGKDFNEDTFREQFNEGWTTWLESYENPTLEPINTIAGDVAAIAGKVVGESVTDNKEESETTSTDESADDVADKVSNSILKAEEKDQQTNAESKSVLDMTVVEAVQTLFDNIKQSATEQQEVAETYKDIQGQSAEELQKSGKEFWSNAWDWFIGKNNEPSTSETTDSISEANDATTDAATQLSTGAESLSAAGEGLNTAATNLTNAAAILASMNTPQTSSTTIPGMPSNIPQEAESSVSGVIVVDNSAALAALDEVKSKAEETKSTIEAGATFKVTVKSGGLKRAANQATKITKTPSDKNINIKATATGKEDTDALTQAVKNFRALNDKTINLKANASGASEVWSAITAVKEFYKLQNDEVKITTIKETKVIPQASGSHNHGYAPAPPSMGSAARGNYGQVGPKGKGGLTLTGELGYEVAWIPSENRSMILGANGPQMINLPGDAVVWNHEQSKKILKQGSIPAGSANNTTATFSDTWDYSNGDKTVNVTVTTGSNGKGSNGRGNGNQIAQDAEKVIQKAGKVTVWWENQTRKIDAINRKVDRSLNNFNTLLKNGTISINKLEDTIVKTYKNNLSKAYKRNEQSYNRASAELYALDHGSKNKAKINYTTLKKGDSGSDVKALQKLLNKNGAKLSVDGVFGAQTQKALKDYQKKLKVKPTGKLDQKTINALPSKYKKQFKAKKAPKTSIDNGGSWTEISYQVEKKKKGKTTAETKKANINLADYIKKKNGTYVIDQKKLNEAGKGTKGHYKNTTKGKAAAKKVKDAEDALEKAKKSGDKNKIKQAKEDLKKAKKAGETYYVKGKKGNKSKAEAIKNAAESEINKRLKRQQEAEDNMIKNHEAEVDINNQIEDALHGWKNELTEIYRVTNEIEKTEAKIGLARAENDLAKTKIELLDLTKGLSAVSKDLGENIQTIEKAYQTEKSLLGREIGQLNLKKEANAKELKDALKLSGWEQQYAKRAGDAEKGIKIGSSTVYDKLSESEKNAYAKSILLSKYLTTNADGTHSYDAAAIDKAVKQGDITEEMGKRMKDVFDTIAEAEKNNLDIETELTNKEAEKLKLQEEEKQYYKDIAEQLFGWKNTLTEILEISTKLKQASANEQYLKSAGELFEAQISAGFKVSTDQILSTFSGKVNATIAKIQNTQAAILRQQEQMAKDQSGHELVERLAAIDKLIANDKSGNIEVLLAERQNILDEIEAAKLVRNNKYGSVTQNADGTLSISYNQDAIDAAVRNGDITQSVGEKMVEYYQTLEADSEEYKKLQEELLQNVADVYKELSELQKKYADSAKALREAYIQQQQEQIDKLKSLNESVNSHLSQILDKVKQSIDERRQAEDNAKTEEDLAKKQRRLAMMRGATSGGNAVEAAQLQKELAEDQQAYGRTLEDQLLSKISQQNDAAAKERQKQTQILQAQHDWNKISGTYAKQVDEWLNYPGQFESQITNVLTNAENLKQLTEAEQNAIENQIGERMNIIKTAPEEIKILTAAINGTGGLQSAVENVETQIKNSIDTAKKDVTDSLKNIKSAQEAVKKAIEETSAESIDITKEIQKQTTLMAKQQAAADYEDFLYDRGNATDTGAAYWGKIGKVGFSAQVARGEMLGYSVGQVARDLAKTDALTWVQIVKAAKADGYSKEEIATWSTSEWLKKALKDWDKYATGGLNKSTGPAWLDGTPSKPELVLNSTDTRNFLALRDVLSRAIGSIGSVENTYGGDATYEININVDKLTSDYDVDKVAERVKKIIVKDAGYRNVTQVRNLR